MKTLLVLILLLISPTAISHNMVIEDGYNNQGMYIWRWYNEPIFDYYGNDRSHIHRCIIGGIPVTIYAGGYSNWYYGSPTC